MHGPYDDMHDETREEYMESLKQKHQVDNKYNETSEKIKYCPYCGKLLKI